MSAFLPSSALGLPASLDYKLPPSLSDDSKAYWVNVAPDGVNTVSANGLQIFSGTVNTSQLNAFNSQLITFTIPSGTSKSVFMDPRETSLNFRLAIQVTTAPAGGAGVTHNLISSAQSFFDSLILYSNNIPIEQINGYNILANQLLATTVNVAEKYGGCAVAMGCDTNTTTGVDLNVLTTAAGYYYWNFSIPLISVIGINNGDRLFPIGSLGNLQLQMQTAALLPFSSYNTTACTTTGSMNVTLDQFSLNMKYVDIGMDSARLLYSTLPDGKVFMKTQTWIQSAVNVPTGSSGQSNLLYQIRNSSLKSLLIQNSQATSLICPNGLYDAVNLAVTQFNVSVGGLQYPQRPLNPSQRPAEAFMALMSALGFSGDYKKYGGVINRSAYGASTATIASGTQNGYDTMIVVPAAGLRAESAIFSTSVSVSQYPNAAYLGVDFEKSGGLLFNGINTRASPPVGNFYINSATTAASTSFAFGLVDCVLVVDTAAQTIAAYV